MPKLLIVKTSSMGDVIHALPVLQDLKRHDPSWSVDWMVEAPFSGVLSMHSVVDEVWNVAVRRWRKRWWTTQVQTEWRTFRDGLQKRHYDLVLDLQGLLKSAWLASKAQGLLVGYDRHSIREPLASCFYERCYSVPKQLHAVERNRRLAAAALGYVLNEPIDYGLAIEPLIDAWLPERPYVVMLHATSREDKQWQFDAWLALAKRLDGVGMDCVLPWGSEAEQKMAQQLAQAMPNAIVAPRLSLAVAAALLRGARLTVGVDTGLSHLAAAVGCPTIALFCASEPRLTGVMADTPCWNLGGNGKPPSVGEVWMQAQQVLL
ncbi:lipopolysaccharide heptosyltransferase I [Chitinivorax sp. B]|uniref:lipopolysaccharide heptosyltransferase I n=1 Tax=Chitinivorax sp. B TaxID=2502235 RepID=UPI0010F63B49|nr:lipopolysaccharide heptosyltransferase I [Chitinivorax sp. B]